MQIHNTFRLYHCLHLSEVFISETKIRSIRLHQVTDLPLPPHNATSCQHNMWYLIQLLMTLYVVSSP
ncbi:hypothetical protein EJ111_24195 [Escherichia coli]|nr:hypothetical protein EJ111_24195 [Escherichia coli]